jgi:hypothetical protein
MQPRRKMNRSVWVILVFISIAVFGVAGCQYQQKPTVFAQNGKTVASEPSPDGSIKIIRAGPDTTNIHYDGRYCLECHQEIPLPKSEVALKYNGEFRYLCSCHTQNRQMHPHPVDDRPSGQVKIAEGFPLRDKKLACITCHDIISQCQDNLEEKVVRQGQAFLRGAPYKNRSDICFRCHDPNRYRKYNPHIQIGENGAIVHEKCLYCHAQVPDEKKTSEKDVKLIGNFGAICMGCHYRAAKVPLHQKHLRKPSDEVLAQIQRMQTQFNIVLPLDQNGQVTCVTCHNPHQKGLIPDKRAGAAGAGALHRHRLGGNMCIKCHPMR